MRKKIIAGNWKMNKTPSEAVALINELKPLVANYLRQQFNLKKEEMAYYIWTLLNQLLSKLEKETGSR